MIKKLAKYIGQYKKYVLVAPILVLLDVIAELSMPLLMSKIVDVGIPGGDNGYIVRIGIYMILLAIAAIVLGVMNMKVSATAGQGFGANLREALFKKVQSFSFTNIDHFSSASLITRLTNDVNNLQMTFIMGIRLMLRAPMMLIVALILAFQINAQLSLVLAVAIPILVIAIAFIMSKAVKLYAVMQEKIDALNNTVQENLIGIRVVKSFVRQNHEKKKFKKTNDDLTAAAIRAANLALTAMPIMMFVINGATIAIMWFGGGMVGNGTMGTGELISFISYVMQILISIMMLSMVILMIARAEASGKRILEVLDEEVDIVDPVSLTTDTTNLQIPASGMVAGPVNTIKTGKVEFRDVSFKYAVSGSGEYVLNNIDFVIQPGELVGIVGGTGTGKTTMVNLIPRLYDVTDGAVLVDDVDVREYNLTDLRKGIGVVLQQNTLFSGTIRENLLWGNEHATQEELETACKDAQAHDFIMSFPQGYDTVLGQGGVNISGGQKQRLYIARAMLKKPKVLILDDSTSAVDSATEAKIRESFHSNLKDTTVFIIAQRISSVNKADKILVLDDGKIVGMGSHQELMAGNAVYQEINTSQQEGVLSNA
ncbi:MAG TPA: multidrug ABC transporter ATP-binding protein [Anaerolineaceae bacterium]|nr:multidrug ABC transporter ATP-binding protein [Anaerolineaceae bacterium]